MTTGEMKKKLLAITSEGVEDIFRKMYDLLESETGLSFTGDLSPFDSLSLEKIQEELSDFFMTVAKENVLPKDGTFFRVCITQVINGEIVGHSVLSEQYDTVDDAHDAALHYSGHYDYPSYQINAYSPKRTNLISFFKQEGDTWAEDPNDTGIAIARVSMDHILRKEE